MVCKIRDVIPKTGNLAFPLWRCWTKPRLSSGPHQAPATSRGPDWYLNASNCSLFLGDKSTIWIPEHRRVSFQQYFILILTTFNLPGTVKVLNQTKTQFLKLFISFPTCFFFNIYWCGPIPLGPFKRIAFAPPFQDLKWWDPIMKKNCNKWFRYHNFGAVNINICEFVCQGLHQTLRSLDCVIIININKILWVGLLKWSQYFHYK